MRFVWVDEMRVLLTIEYKGTAYCGWQRQKNALSVQEVLASAYFTLTGEKVTMHGSGRTDAGVHALGQCVHFDTNACIPPERLPFALNPHLPADIKVKAAREVPADFNARFDVVRKTYVYKFYVSPHESPLRFDTHCHLVTPPNLERMRACAKKIEGTHDFRCFQATGGHVKSTVRTVYSVDIQNIGDEYAVTVCGNGFLYNMVRIIAGTLYWCGIGKIEPEAVDRAFETGDRKLLGKTLEAKGLYLAKVEYDL